MDGKLVTTFPCITKVWSVAFSPHGEQMLTGLSDGTVSLWAVSGKLVTTLNSHSEVVVGVIFSLDSHLVMAYDQNGRVLLWRASEPERENLWECTSLLIK